MPLGLTLKADLRIAERCKLYRESIGVPWFTKPWDLNLLVVRSGSVGLWDDLVLVICADDTERLIVQRVRATGDAWEGEWKAPTHPQGAVYVVDQHVPGGLELGEHRGRPALRQRRAFLNVRWSPDGTVPTVDQLQALTPFPDIRGTHLHNRHNGRAPDIPAPDDSEGCTVSLYYHEHIAMIELVKQQLRWRGSAVVSPTFLRAEMLPKLTRSDLVML